jgi:hypothetical protein
VTEAILFTPKKHSEHPVSLMHVGFPTPLPLGNTLLLTGNNGELFKSSPKMQPTALKTEKNNITF